MNHGIDGMQTPERKMLTILEACQLVGVSRRTVYNWMADGKVDYVRTAGGAVRIFADSLWRAPDQGRPHSLRGVNSGRR
jgi:excisionase family DNA binding protein